MSESHVPHGNFVKSLQIGDAVEVSEGGLWLEARVDHLRCDGLLLRHIKLALAGGLVEDKMWVGAEDGLIAPPGTHLGQGKMSWECSDLSPAFDEHVPSHCG
jgi:hypothetical protein